MSRRFLANLSFVILLNLLIKPAYILGIEVSVQNTVGAEAYGIFFALLNGAYLFQIINDFGIQIYNSRLIAQDPGRIARLFPGLLSLKGLLALLYFITVILYGYVFGYTGWMSLLILVAVNLMLLSLVLFLRSSIAALGHYRLDSMLSVLDKALMIVICGYLLFLSGIDFNIYHFVYAQMVSLGITACISLLLLRTRGTLTLRWPKAGELRGLLRQSWPYAVTVFLMTIYTRIDGVMIERLADSGTYQAGVYAAGYRLLDAANMISFLFAGLLLPMFSSLEHHRDELKRLLGLAFRFMWAFTVACSVVAFFFSSELMQFLYVQAGSGAWSGVFGVLIISLNAIGLMYVFGTCLTAGGRIRTQNVLYGCCVVLNIGLNFILIRTYGAWGAAVATLITQSTVAAVLVFLVQRHLALQVQLRNLLSPVLYAVGAIGIVWSISEFAAGGWFLRLVLATAFVFLLAYLVGLVGKREIRAFITLRDTAQ